MRVPRTRPFAAAGPLALALSGPGAGGGITGAPVGLGLPEDRAVRDEGRMRKGGLLMSVHADDQAWASEARQVLEQTGAEDISSIGASRRNVASTHRPARLEPVA